MQQSMRRTIASLLTAFLLLGFGTACRSDPLEQTPPVSAPATQQAELNPPIEETVISSAEKGTPMADDIVVTPTPTGTPVPTDTPVPTPSPTPVPNPYAGVWTIEDLPFSL